MKFLEYYSLVEEYWFQNRLHTDQCLKDILHFLSVIQNIDLFHELYIDEHNDSTNLKSE